MVSGHSQNVIQVAYDSNTDEQIQTTIFHELLHVDEANNTIANGNRVIWKIREGITQNNRHDPIVTEYDGDYKVWLLTPEAQRDRVSKPKLSDLPWRN